MSPVKLWPPTALAVGEPKANAAETETQHERRSAVVAGRTAQAGAKTDWHSYFNLRWNRAGGRAGLSSGRECVSDIFFQPAPVEAILAGYNAMRADAPAAGKI